MPFPENPSDHSKSADSQDPERAAAPSATPLTAPQLSTAHVLAWVHGHGPVPAPHSASRPAHDAIQSLRTERELALADRRQRTPAAKSPVMPSRILNALLDPAVIDLRHYDVVQHTRTPAQYFVAFDPETDELLSWEAGDPGRVKRWAPASCRGDAQLTGLIRAGREARYPWVYPDVPARATPATSE